MKKYVHMGNVYFKCATSKSEIHCIMGYIKKKKLKGLKVHYSQI
jgi:hypothetical protein